MPSVPVEGQAKPVRGVATTTVIQPPPEDVKPELALPLPKPPSQEELAEQAIAVQNVAKRNAMTPSTSPAKESLTEEERVERAKKAIAARWSKRYDWETAPLEEALEYLAEIRVECERGGTLLEKRVSELKIERVKCYACENIINLSEGRFAGMRTRNNFETNIPESFYACSARCYLIMTREVGHPVRIREELNPSTETAT